MIVVPWSGPDSPLAWEVIQHLELTSGLKLCLDAGDAASYAGSGQSWLDRSGNGADFLRGATNSATTDDPTFNGSAGSLSAYWGFDGGDSFRYDSANETWMNAIHKDSAKFTLLTWFYPGSVAVTQSIFGTGGNSSSNIGCRFGITSGGALIMMTANGSGSAAMSRQALAPAAGTWQMMAASVDEADAGGGLMMLNATADAGWNPTYASPSAAAATRAMEIGAAGNAAQQVENGSRMALACAWEGAALTQTQIVAFYNLTRERFGV